jgi:hypothetical protein
MSRTDVERCEFPHGRRTTTDSIAVPVVSSDI